MFKAGGRLFVDIAANLATPAGRKMMIDVMGEHDPLIRDAIVSLISRGDFIKPLPDGESAPAQVKSSKGKPFADIMAQIPNEPSVAARTDQSEARHRLMN